jgi:hypothetical protein
MHSASTQLAGPDAGKRAGHNHPVVEQPVLLCQIHIEDGHARIPEALSILYSKKKSAQDSKTLG